jgi:2,3-bisphosphoglycerate-dependent phosphoglycerate mutase
MTMTYHITLLRHGESIGNAGNYYQGLHDFDLSARGEAQAQALAEEWYSAGVSFDQVISSPLLRARRTAEIIAARLGIPLEFDPDWMEMDNGVLAGLKQEVADELYPWPDFRNLYEPIGQTGESEWDVFLRACRAVARLMQRPPGRYLVVAHGAILNRALKAMLGIMPQPNFHGTHFNFVNTGYIVLEYRPERHEWLVLKLSDRDHSPPTTA